MVAQSAVACREGINLWVRVFNEVDTAVFHFFRFTTHEGVHDDPSTGCTTKPE
ncbi:hypothetical protein LMG29739_00149 [Paraburkholderia solisilvae]|uniref:Uncharacterized protein n=1 Tax=Paraburkholderia solisilvae TaxID=624376 RepID=A0A6J5D0W3_9BURK|nr:hypothetical protein LMG29739_00149 [Paraburkholderia solisilvae]